MQPKDREWISAMLVRLLGAYFFIRGLAEAVQNSYHFIWSYREILREEYDIFPTSLLAAALVSFAMASVGLYLVVMHERALAFLSFNPAPEVEWASCPTCGEEVRRDMIPTLCPACGKPVPEGT